MLAPIGGCIPRPFRLSPDGQAALLPYRREEYPLDSPLKDEGIKCLGEKSCRKIYITLIDQAWAR